MQFSVARLFWKNQNNNIKANIRSFFVLCQFSFCFISSEKRKLSVLAWFFFYRLWSSYPKYRFQSFSKGLSRWWSWLTGHKKCSIRGLTSPQFPELPTRQSKPAKAVRNPARTPPWRPSQSQAIIQTLLGPTSFTPKASNRQCRRCHTLR